MKITVCIGSSCHIKGSRDVVTKLQELVEEYSIGDKVSIEGTFCFGECQKGVCVKIGDTVHSVSTDTVEDFFKSEILAKV